MAAAIEIAGWALAIVILAAIVLLSVVVYFLIRKRVTKSRASVGTQDDMVALEKSVSSSITAYYPVKPLTAYSSNDCIVTEDNEKKTTQTNYLPVQNRNRQLNNSKNADATASILPTIAYGSSSDIGMSTTVRSDEKSSTHDFEQDDTICDSTVIQLTDPFKEEDTVSTVSTNDTSLAYQTNEQYHFKASKGKDFKFELPLPPPSSSLFADKMELNSDEADELYHSYFSISTQQQQGGGEMLADDSNNTRAFLSAAAATIQQKAATIRSNLRQSIRRKSTVENKSHAPLSELFNIHGSTVSHDNYSQGSNSSASHKTSEAANCISFNDSGSSVNMSRRQSSSTTVSAQQQPRNSLQATSVFTASSSTHFLTPPVPSTATILSDKCSTHSSNYTDPHDSRKLSVISSTAKGYLSSAYNNYANKNAKKELGEITDESNSSNKIMIEDETISQPIQQQKPFCNPCAAPSLSAPQHSTTTESEDNTHFANNKDEAATEHLSQPSSEIVQQQETTSAAASAASAARKVIRSASRKSQKTRSMIIDATTTEPDYQTEYLMLEHVSSAHHHNGKYQDTISQNRSDCTKAIEPVSSPKNSAVMTVGRAFGKASNNNNNYSSKITDARPLNGIFIPARSPQDFPSPQLSTANGKAAQNEYQTRTGHVEVSTSHPSSDTSKSSATDLHNKLAEIADSSIDDNSYSPTSPTSPIYSKGLLSSDSSSRYSTLQLRNSNIAASSSNVDTIRKMLQASWSNSDVKESGSSFSLASSTSSSTQTARQSSSSSNRNSTNAYPMDSLGSIINNSRQVASPIGSLNPRLQNKHLVSLSLRLNSSPQQQQLATSSVTRRPAMPAAFYKSNSNNNWDSSMADEEEGLEGPMPTASFSSSTVRTMIPEDEVITEQQQYTAKEKLIQQERAGSTIRNSTRPINNKSKTIKSTEDDKRKKNHNKKTPAQQEREKYLRSLKAQS
ncbi:hypothetical protein BDF20DRAFT_911043 [Mycotypha africana]|uniref:uncharacterized protein n=1 Tax=Mycotypha africana TaxID=64632 RepID=UPI0022FFFCEF|nr:uncharacterized protein BDF20DRAFT_911043 [Mycotypha africana]KAI8988590.1 hypothetical protein BDF20DRAFT_911043 [Mycotypha africana]